MEHDPLCGIIFGVRTGCGSMPYSIGMRGGRLTTVPYNERDEYFPLPGECHPYYDDGYEFVKRWIEYPKPDYRIVVPVRRTFTVDFLTEVEPDYSTVDLPQMLTIERRKVAAWAPYVGRPFAYWWWAGTDNLGRWVAANTVHLHYLIDEFEWDAKYAV
jgi:hypothetical protein